MRRVCGYLWALPVTLIGVGLALLAAATGGVLHWRNGVVEAAGGMLGWLLRGGRFRGGGAAMTLGHVILARNAECLEHSREHELIHVRQYERWGVLLLPVWWLIALWLSLRGYHPYLDHPLEPPPR